MRTLTEDQRNLLKTHLSKTYIEYVELYDEIYDHYASAYEQGENDFESVLNNLDEQFTKEYINDNKTKLSKNIYKKVLALYKKEAIAFLLWPQIIISVLAVAIIMFLVYLLPYSTFLYYVLIPAMLLSLFPYLYFSIQIHRKLILPLNLKSASYEATNKIGSVVVIAFNFLNFISIIVRDNTSDSNNPYILGVSVLLFGWYSVITLKVFKQRIKHQLA